MAKLLATVDSNNCVGKDQLYIDDAEAMKAIIDFLPRNKRTMLRDQREDIEADGFDDRGEMYKLTLKNDGNGIAFCGPWDWIRLNNAFEGEIHICGITNRTGQGIGFRFTKSPV